MSQSTPPDEQSATVGAAAPAAAEHEIVTTLFDLGRQVTSVLDLDDLLHQIPRLIARLISFDVFAVYLLDQRRSELKVAYSVGYPQDAPGRLKLGEGVVGAAVATEQPLLVNDVKIGRASCRERV